MEPVTIRIEGRPALGALLAAAGLALIGLAVLVAGSLLDWGAAAGLLGALLVVAGIVLVVLSRRAARRSGLAATLDGDGYRIVAGGAEHVGGWGDVRRVALAGNVLSVQRADGERLAIGAPPGTGPDEMDALAGQFARRLDAARGYGRPW